MKLLLILIALLLLVTRLNAETRYMNTKTGELLDVNSLAGELEKYDVIFFGELHSLEPVHHAQAELSQALADAHHALSFSFEMWERDTQSLVDQFMAGSLDEDRFVQQSRAWGNYKSYRPMLMLAKERQQKVIAANIPRDYATRVAREGWGFVHSLPPEDRRLIAQRLSAPENKYKKEFFAIMSNMGGHEASPEDLENYYLAQCIKDDTMAESIALHLKTHPGGKIIHFNGDFHSRAWLGTVSSLQELMPDLRLAVISPEFVEDPQNPDLPAGMDAVANYLLLLKHQPQEGN